MVIKEGDPLPEFDYHCPLLSLPLAFKTNIANIPFSHGYLKAPSSKLPYWKEMIKDDSKPRIGLVWSGSRSHVNDKNRSLPLSLLTQNIPSGFVFYSLQKEVRESDKETLSKSDIKNYGDFLNDFEDTACLCELMDIVISVDTSVAHLSAALGKKTIILLPDSPDWRWMIGLKTSPWYQNVCLIRGLNPSKIESFFKLDNINRLIYNERNKQVHF